MAGKGLMDERRYSVAAQMGKEGEQIQAGSFAGFSIGVFTSGGDSQGKHKSQVTVVYTYIISMYSGLYVFLIYLVTGAFHKH